MESNKEEEIKQKIELQFVDNSRKRKRNQLKGPAGYGLSQETKKRKLDNESKNLNDQEDAKDPAHNDYLVIFCAKSLLVLIRSE